MTKKGYEGNFGYAENILVFEMGGGTIYDTSLSYTGMRFAFCVYVLLQFFFKAYF